MKRINQLYTALKFFRQAIQSKYSLVNYTNPNEPVFLWGCYKSQQQTLIAHKSFAVVCWCGSDAMLLATSPGFVSQLKGRDNIKHIATSKFISQDLHQVGIDHVVIPLTPFTHDDIKLQPRGDSMYTYTAPSNPTFYGEHFARRVAERTGIPLIIANKDTYTRKQLLDVYRDCFIGLRLTPHDGVPTTGIELGMMGRMVVHNGSMPNCINYKTEDDIVRIVQQQFKLRGEENASIRSAMAKFIDCGDDFLNIKYWYNVKPVQRNKTKPILIDIPGKVSVVMNSYKENPAYLNDAIISYLTQKHVDVELIVSMVMGDKNIKFIQDKFTKYLTNGRMKIIVNNKPGIYYQLNNAIKHITGQWYCYASSNDVALENKLYHEVSTLIRTGKKICYSSFIKCDSDLNRHKTHRSKPYNLQAHYSGNFVNDCAMISVDILMKYYPFNGSLKNHGYHDFWLRVAQGEGPQVFIHSTKETWLYRINSDSQHIRRRENPALIKQNQQDFIVMRGLHKEHEKKIAKELMHFVYVYKKDTAIWKELVFSVESVRKRYQGSAKIFVVGDAPGVRGCIHIPHKVEEGMKANKALDSILKLQLIADHPDINDDFVYMYDDIIFLNPINKTDLSMVVAHNKVNDIQEYIDKLGRKPSKQWLNLFRITFTKIQKHGRGSWNYETHLPRIFNKENVKQVIKTYGMEQQPMLFASAYFNHFHEVPTTTLSQLPNFKAGFYYPINDLDKIRRDIKFKKFLNYDDIGLTKQLQQVIREQSI